MMRGYMGRFWIVFLYIAAVCFSVGVPESCAFASTYAVSVKDGLSQQNGNPAVSLDSWEYTWEDLKGNGETKPPDSGWKQAKTPLNPPGRDGRNILWLRAAVPDGSWKEPILQLQVYQLFEVYIDGKLIYKFGEIQDPARSNYIGTLTRFISLPEETLGKTVYIRVYSDSPDIGITNHTQVSGRSDVILSMIKNQAQQFIFGFFYIIIGLVFIYPYILLKQKLLLQFAGFALSFGLYTVSRRTLIYFFADRPMFWTYTNLASLILAIASITAFLEQFFGGRLKGFMGILWRLHLIYGIVFLPSAALGLIRSNKGVFGYQFLMLVTIGFVIVHMSQKALKGNKEAVMILVGTLIFGAAGIADILNNIWNPNGGFPQVSYLGAFVLLMMLIVILTRRMIIMQSRLYNSDKLSVAGQLAAGVAHEIRNPLTVISGYLQLMKKDPKNQTMIEVMLGEVNRINGIMNEFLFLAKPVKPKFLIHSIGHILRDVLLLFQAQAADYGFRLILHCPEELPKVYCDQNQLKQVFINVIKNAMEAMPNGGDITIQATENAGTITIVFQDQGCGIPEKELSQIGAPFYTTKENGSGLGLMVSRSIIESHKGKLRLESELDVGTRVVIELPVLK